MNFDYLNLVNVKMMSKIVGVEKHRKHWVFLHTARASSPLTHTFESCVVEASSDKIVSIDGVFLLELLLALIRLRLVHKPIA